MKKNPQSPWRASVLAVLGSIFLERGSYANASDLLESAWKLTGGEAKTLDGKLLASAVAADLTTVLAKTNRKADLQALLGTLGKKELLGSSRSRVLSASVYANATPVSRAPAGACGLSALAQLHRFSNPQAAGEYQRITRDYDVLKQQYDKLLHDREELKLRGSVETEHNAVKFQVIDPPTTPRSPIAPNRPVLLLGVLLMGLGAGAAAAFAVGQLRSTFATTGRLEKAIGLPVLGAISQTLTDSGRALRRKRMTYFYAASTALAGIFVLLLTIEFIQRGMVA